MDHNGQRALRYGAMSGPYYSFNVWGGQEASQGVESVKVRGDVRSILFL